MPNKNQTEGVFINSQVERFEDVNYIGKKEIEEKLNEKFEVQKDELEVKADRKEGYIPNPVTDKYQSIQLPSNFIFYDFKDIKVRKFEIRDLAKMSKVVKTESHKLFKEVIQSCINQDINALTTGDFKYLCYWLRLNSYPNTPMSINWKSKYGNDNISIIQKTDIITLSPDITEQQLAEWRSKGFEVPTMGFSDVFSRDDLPEDEDMIYSNAQYFKGKTWEEKIATMENYLNENGLEAINNVSEFDKLIDHGVQEEVTVKDLKFFAPDYKKSLEERINKIKSVLNTVTAYDSDEAALLNLTLEELEKEYQELTRKMDAGEEVLAEPETIFLEVDANEFLSPILSAVN